MPLCQVPNHNVPSGATPIDRTRRSARPCIPVKVSHCSLPFTAKVRRETPFSVIHLENMLRLARAGAVIMPANPGFYHNPDCIADLVDFMVARVLDHLGVEHELLPRWGEADA